MQLIVKCVNDVHHTGQGHIAVRDQGQTSGPDDSQGTSKGQGHEEGYDMFPTVYTNVIETNSDMSHKSRKIFENQLNDISAVMEADAGAESGEANGYSVEDELVLVE